MSVWGEFAVLRTGSAVRSFIIAGYLMSVTVGMPLIPAALASKPQSRQQGGE